MVYNNLGPLGAIKKSVQVLRKTWGESVIRYVGIGVVQMISIILAFLVGIVLFFIGAMSGNAIIFLNFTNINNASCWSNSVLWTCNQRI